MKYDEALEKVDILIMPTTPWVAKVMPASVDLFSDHRGVESGVGYRCTSPRSLRGGGRLGSSTPLFECHYYLLIFSTPDREHSTL